MLMAILNNLFFMLVWETRMKLIQEHRKRVLSEIIKKVGTV
jgi:hypothetical protein